MALLFFDGFDTYADATAAIGLASRWSNVANMSMSASGRFAGSRCITNTGTSNATLRTPTLGSNLTSMAVAFAFTRNTLSGTAGTGVQICWWLDSAAGVQCTLNVDTNGDFVFYRGNGAANLGTSNGSRRIVAGTWHFLEIELVISDTVGTFKMWVDSTQVFNLSGLDNKATAVVGANFFEFILVNASTIFEKIDDLYITDGTRLGERRAVLLAPSADTAQKDWTADTGSDNYARVDDTAGPDSDTSYVQASAVGNKDRYDVTNLPGDTLSVDAISVSLCARKTDVTARAVRANLKSGGTTDNGTPITLATSYAMNRKTYLTDPNTAAAWTVSNVNAVQLEVEVTT